MRNRSRGHHDGRCKQQTEIARICDMTDCCSKANGRNGPSPEVEVFRHNTGVPCATSGSDQSSDKPWNNSRHDQMPPSLPTAETKDVRSFLQVSGDRHRTSDDIEEHIPLCAEQEQND